MKRLFAVVLSLSSAQAIADTDLAPERVAEMQNSAPIHVKGEVLTSKLPEETAYRGACAVSVKLTDVLKDQTRRLAKGETIAINLPCRGEKAAPPGGADGYTPIKEIAAARSVEAWLMPLDHDRFAPLAPPFFGN